MNRELLEKPFPKSVIKTRRGRMGKNLEYVGVPEFVGRLNDAFAGYWSFDILGSQVLGDHIVVTARLTAPRSEHCEHEVSKTAFGGATITRDKSGEALDIGDDFKAAASDALKKAASLLGVGLHIYGLEPAREEPSPEPHPPPITPDQRERITAVAHELGYSAARLDQMIETRYTRPIGRLTTTEAAEVLAGLRRAATQAAAGAA